MRFPASIGNSFMGNRDPNKCEVTQTTSENQRSSVPFHPNDQVLFVFDGDSSVPSVFSAGQTRHLPEPFPRFGIPIEEIFTWDW